MMKLITGASALLLATTVHAGPGFEVARSTAISCPASNGTVYEATSGKFEILCGIDYDSKNTAMSLTSTFEDCVEACDATSGCVDVSYVYSAQACYLKSDSGSPYANADIWSARSTDSSLTLPASVDAETLDKRATSKAAALTCENSVSDGTAYTSSNGTVFQIACSTDYSGGDLFEQDTTSFSACIDLCSVTSGCVDITYIGTSCYLKSILTAPIMNSTVWGARSNISAVSSPAASATSSSKSSTITSSTAASATGVVGPYSQCGGSGWTGATACVSGYSCWSQNAYYYQCTYGVTSTTSSSTSSSVPAKTTSSSTSTTPTSTSSSTKTSSTSSSSAKAVATAGAYGQCGGTGWTGATACPAGYTCTYQNAYYYQCIA